MKVVVLDFMERKVDVILNVPDEVTYNLDEFDEFMDGLGYDKANCQWMSMPDDNEGSGEICECLKSDDGYVLTYLGPVNF